MNADAGQVDAGQPCSRFVAANSVDSPAEIGVGHQDVEDNGDNHQNHGQHGNARPGCAAKLGYGQTGTQTAPGQPGELWLG